MWESDKISKGNCVVNGRLVVLGSVEIFSDDWIEKEENSKLFDLLISLLTNDGIADLPACHETDFLEGLAVPFIEALSQGIKPCLQGIEELPRNFTEMLDLQMFHFDTDLTPLTLKLYDLLGVPQDSLTLIPPQFECPLPKLLPSTFSPAVRDAMSPALDQFDLDEHFAKEGLRLAQLTNKCANGIDDLEYYISESGDILGVMQSLSYGERGAKNILFHILGKLMYLKNQDDRKL